MAPISKFLALGALFAATSSAAPYKRDDAVVWQTITEVAWTTVDITTTVTDSPPKPTVQTSIISLINPQPTPSEQPETTSTPAPETSTVAPAAPTVAPEPSESTPTPAPTTEEPAPAPTTIAPTTTAVPEPEPSSSTSAPASTGAPSTGRCSEDSPCTGQVTFYDVATSASAPSSCGYTNDGEAESVLALPAGLMQDSDCGKTVSVKYNGLTVTGKVVDKCMGCDSSSIDLSKHFFGELASMTLGRLHGVEWWIH